MRPSLRHKLRNLRTALKDVGEEVWLNTRRGSELRRSFGGKTGLLLHVGCGPNILPGWVNVDVDPRTKGAIYFDAINSLPLADASVKRIHCEHFLEHLHSEHAKNFLSECRRVLEPAGSMRIIVPDAETYMLAYTAKDAAFFDKLRHLGNASKPLETNAIICNQMFRMGGGHQFAWDFQTMEFICRKIGFTSVSRSTWGAAPEGYQVDGKDDWRQLESLYVELTR